MRRSVGRLLAGMVVGVLAITGIIAVQSTIASAPKASAANAADFNPGNIISDVVFYNNKTMTIAQIQSFLNVKVPRCQSGYTCLKEFRQTTASRVADAHCAAYTGASNESAAAIIYKVSIACGINPQVILATLEKEQGLVTNNWPSDFRYRSAMGYGCPDTAPCDAQYYGFYNQVYKAAWQFKVYQRYPSSFNFVAGRNNSIQWSPSTSCGTSQVYIQNQATAGLYNYTPYRPNAAALANLYGTGDGCSSYGNRNFWRIFTDWFGTTQSKAVDPLLLDYYQQQGGPSGILGVPLANATRYADGGVGQQFTNYGVFWSAATGFDLTTGSIGREYETLGGAGGKMGYPTGTYTVHANGGRSQAFQNGDFYWSPSTSVQYVTGVIKTTYDALGAADGSLGYPVGPYSVVASIGRMQKFQNGSLYWSSTTPTQVTTGTIGTAYEAGGGPSGAMGFPTGVYSVTAQGGRNQQFQNGSYFWLPSAGTSYMAKALVGGYEPLGGLASAYGYPVKNSVDYGNGTFGVQLQAGWLFTSVSGAYLTTGVLGAGYVNLGGPTSVLGYPTGVYTASATGRSQQYKNGVLYWSTSTGLHYVLSPLAETYAQNGGNSGKYGYPTANSKAYAGGGYGQSLKGGGIYWSKTTGGFATTGALGSYYLSLGGPSSSLGYPIGPYTATVSARTQKFEHGTLTWTVSRGVVRS